jgi:HrpA-like RNA helicase
MCARRRPDLKAIVSSATLDVDRFSAYFGGCPVVTVPGRAHPVDIYHSKTKQVRRRPFLIVHWFVLWYRFNGLSCPNL